MSSNPHLLAHKGTFLFLLNPDVTTTATAIHNYPHAHTPKSVLPLPFLKKERWLPMLQAENPAYLKYKTATNWKRPGKATACCNRIKGYISGNASGISSFLSGLLCRNYNLFVPDSVTGLPNKCYFWLTVQMPYIKPEFLGGKLLCHWIAKMQVLLTGGINAALLALPSLKRLPQRAKRAFSQFLHTTHQRLLLFLPQLRLWIILKSHTKTGQYNRHYAHMLPHASCLLASTPV